MCLYARTCVYMYVCVCVYMSCVCMCVLLGFHLPFRIRLCCTRVKIIIMGRRTPFEELSNTHGSGEGIGISGAKPSPLIRDIMIVYTGLRKSSVYWELMKT